MRKTDALKSLVEAIIIGGILPGTLFVGILYAVRFWM